MVDLRDNVTADTDLGVGGPEDSDLQNLQVENLAPLTQRFTDLLEQVDSTLRSGSYFEGYEVTFERLNRESTAGGDTRHR